MAGPFSTRSRHSPRLGVCLKPPGSAMNDVLDVSPNCVIRTGFAWSYNEPTQGTYRWTATDDNVARYEAAGVRCLAVLSAAPAWASSVPNGQNPPPADQFYPNCFAWMTALASRYKGRIEAYEIWNEPQGIGDFTVDQYKRLMIGAYPAIKAGDPDALVVGMGANGTYVDANQDARNAWYSAVLSDPDVLASMDVASLHTYARPKSPEEGYTTGPMDTRLENTLTFLQSKGFTKPVWSTEGGWPTEPTTINGYTTEEDQARYMARLVVILMSYQQIDRFYAFQLYGQIGGGEVGGMGLIRPDNTKKAAFTSYSVACKKLERCVSITRISDNPVRIYRFDKPGQYGFVAWTVSGTGNVIIQGLPEQVEKTDMFGQSSIMGTASGNLSLTVGIDPIYVETI